MEIDPVVKALQAPKFKESYDEFVKLSGIDPKKDPISIGLGAPFSDDAGRIFMPTRGTLVENVSIVASLNYDKARLQGLIKEKIPEAKEDIYNGVTVYSNLVGGGYRKWIRAAFLDASHIALGSDKGVKGIIDVFQRKAEPLAKSPEMTALLGRVDKSGIAWWAASYPAELLKKAAESNPQLAVVEWLEGMTLAFDEKNSGFFVEYRTLGGTKEQNTAAASYLNGLRALGLMRLTQEPALGELLNAIDIASGKDYTRLTVTASYETVGRLWQLARTKFSDLTKPKEGEPEKDDLPAPGSAQDRKAGTGPEAAYRESIIAQAEEMHRALMSGDLDTFIAYMPSKMLALAGGAAVLKQAIQPGLAEMLSQVEKITLGTISPVVSETDGLAAFVPVEMALRIKGTQVISVSYYVASSEDKGLTWKFMASQGQPEQERLVKQFYPELAGQVATPKCGVVYK
jgi:hypothetical protein